VPALTIPIIGDVSGLNKALGDSKGQVSAFGKSVDVSTLAMGAGIAGAAVIAGKALLDMGQAASQDRLEQDKLTQAIVAATGSQADHTAEVEAAITAGQDKAFTDTQTREALTSLVTATKDVTQATTLLGTAQDVARFAGVDLATAADAVAKAQAGQDGALRKIFDATAHDFRAGPERAHRGPEERDALLHRLEQRHREARLEEREGQPRRSGDQHGPVVENGRAHVDGADKRPLPAADKCHPKFAIQCAIG
jgi:hypothetical protein